MILHNRKNAHETDSLAVSLIVGDDQVMILILADIQFQDVRRGGQCVLNKFHTVVTGSVSAGMCCDKCLLSVHFPYFSQSFSFRFV